MENWKIVRLGDVCEIQSGGTPSRNKTEYWKNGTIPWVKIGDFSGKYLNKTTEHITPKGLENSSAKLFSKGTILYSIFATLGEATILNIDATTNQAIAGIKIKDKSSIDIDYLFAYLNSLKEEVNRIGRGVAQNNINLSILKSFTVPLPPLETQKHIAAMLDKCTALIAKHKLMLEKYDTLIKSRFIEMFGDLKQNSKNWQIKNFKECAKIDTNMVKDFEKYADYPHIGIDSIEKETGKLSGYRTVKEDNVISGKYLFTPEHIIYSKIRPNLNKVAMPDFYGVCSADAYPILVDKEICSKEFFTYVLRSDFYLSYILAFSSRTNMPKVNKEQVESFNMPVPPIELQNDFAAFVQQIDKSKFAVQKSLEKTEILYKSLMQAYFG